MGCGFARCWTLDSGEGNLVIRAWMTCSFLFSLLFLAPGDEGESWRFLPRLMM